MTGSATLSRFCPVIVTSIPPLFSSNPNNYWWLTEVRYWFKVCFSQKLWECASHKVNWIILLEVRFNPCELKLMLIRSHLCKILHSLIFQLAVLRNSKDCLQRILAIRSPIQNLNTDVDTDDVRIRFVCEHEFCDRICKIFIFPGHTDCLRFVYHWIVRQGFSLACNIIIFSLNTIKVNGEYQCLQKY